MKEDIRWEQRFSNFKKALAKLNKAVEVIVENEHDLEDVEEILKEGLIQRFEYTHELAWKVMKDYAEYQGNHTITGSRDATREAFKTGLISNGEIWMDMLASRNLTTHTYNEATAEEIYLKITGEYIACLKEFAEKMEMIHLSTKGNI